MKHRERVLLLVDHGSRRAEANAQLERVAEALRAHGDDAVRTAHLELAPPSIGEAIDACAAEGAREIVVVPWFLSPGRHTMKDIPAQVAEAGRRHGALRLKIAEPLGIDEKLIEVALARAANARDV